MAKNTQPFLDEGVKTDGSAPVAESVHPRVRGRGEFGGERDGAVSAGGANQAFHGSVREGTVAGFRWTGPGTALDARS